MALYQSIHTGEFIDEQISAVSDKLSLDGGIVRGDVEARKFIGPLNGIADEANKVSNALTIKSGNTVLKTFNGSTPDTINFVAGNNIVLTPLDGMLTISATAEPYALPQAGLSLGGVASGGVATINGGVITSITKAAAADTATTATSAESANKIYSSESTAKAYILGTTVASNDVHTTVYNGSVYTSGSVLYGAAWNDYAEYRQSNDEIKPGYCVTSNNDGLVAKTTERLQYSEGIVSDTFGFAIGETDKCKIPLAVSGRVLAYYNGDIADYNAGDPVCAGPNGKVCKMSREEVSMYPDRLIGTVSEIPKYNIWGENDIEVNNRIWIKVR